MAELDYRIVSGVLMILDGEKPVQMAVLPDAAGRTTDPEPLLGGRYAFAVVGAFIHLLEVGTGQHRVLRLPIQQGGSSSSNYVAPTRDCRSFMIFCGDSKSKNTTSGGSRIVVSRFDIDSETIAEVARMPGRLRLRDGRLPREVPDGRWLLPQTRTTDAGLAKGVVECDPKSGSLTETFIPANSVWEDFRQISPDGKYCLCADLTHLPKAFAGDGFRLFGRSPRKRVFGQVVQLWQTRPLSFVRRLTVAWHTADELPNDTTFMAPSVKHDRAYSPPMFEAIADVTQSAATSYDAVPSMTDFPPPFSNSDAEYNYLLHNWREFSEKSLSSVYWSSDSRGFWHAQYGYVGWADIDGNASPRYYLERLGLKSGMVRPFANGPRKIIPGAGRTAVWEFPYKGKARLEAETSAKPTLPVAIPPNKDKWIASPKADDRELFRFAEQANRDFRTISVPLAGMDASSCAAAIRHLCKELDRGLDGRVTNDTLNVVFKTDSARLGELAFFAHVETLGPAMAPALRDLMEALLAAPGLDKIHYLFSDGENGEGGLHGAAKAFARLDPAPIELVKQYGRIMDPEHEYSFVGAVVPALLDNLGWTPDMVDFTIWLLAKHYYNSINHEWIWNDFGFGAAAERMHPDPRQFAIKFLTGIRADYSDPDDPGASYPVSILDLFDREIRTKSAWTKDVFAALKEMPPLAT